MLQGWSGVAKVSCILRHLGFQLIFVNCWARPASLVAGKGRGGMFFISSVSSLSFLFLFLPCPSLSSPLLSLHLFSSPEHEVLMVSYCGQSMSVARHAESTIALKAYSSYTPGPIDLILVRKHLGDL